MTMDFNKLRELPVEELRTLAIQQGLTPHHKLGKDKLVNMIIEFATTPPVQEMKHPAEAPQAAPVKVNTEDEVREACKVFFSKEGYTATFCDDTWHFKYKGSEDSGHMSVPLRVIRMKAETVSRGARKPFIVKNTDGNDVMMAGA